MFSERLQFRNKEMFQADLQPHLKREMQQYVEKILYASSEYGPDTNISYNSINVIGRPNNFPSPGDHSDSYLLTSFGNWRMLAPSFTPEFGLSKIPAEDNPPVDDFIVVGFETSVYPTGMEVYETMSPGGVYRIWAYTESHQWMLLWDKRADATLEDIRNAGLSQSRIFVPAIRTISQRTRVLCIEFCKRDLSYIYGIDAVMLKSGMAETIEREPASYTYHIQNKWENNEALREFQNRKDVIPQRIWNEVREIPPADMPNLPQQPVEWEPQQNANLTNLPYEMLYNICSYLDLKSLRNVEKVSATFHAVVRDSRLYQEVNMRPYWMEMNYQLLEWLHERCANIRKLDLSWCGLFSMFTKEELKSFLVRHGPTLTHLRLNSVGFRDTTDFGISLCPNLKELCLQNMNVKDYIHLGDKLTTLTKLDLSGAYISGNSLRNLLYLNPSLQHLNISCCIYNSFRLAYMIGRYNRELISLNLFKTHALHADDLVPLANCTKLEELNLGYANEEEVQEGELSRLIEACPNLRKLVLAGFRDVHNNDMLTIAQHCPKLEYLDLMGCITVTGESVNAILIGCTGLRFLEINHCFDISDEWFGEWKNRYPQVAIKHN